MLTKEFLLENKRNLQKIRHLLTLDNIPSEFKYDDNNYDFVHHHVHTEYSKLDGAGAVKAFVKKAIKLGQKSLSLTEHGMFNNLVDLETFSKKIAKEVSEAQQKNISLKAIYGMEGYMCSDMSFTRADKNDKDPLTPEEQKLLNERYHIILLAKDDLGVKAIKILSSLAHVKGFYKKPRFDFKLLTSYIDEKDHGKGRLCDHLVVLSGCLAGEVAVALSLGDYERAKQVAIKFRDNIEDYYLEVQLHKPSNSDRQLSPVELELLDREMRVNEGLYKLSDELGIPVVCTCDAHYVEPDGYQTQDMLMCIDSGKTLADTDRFRIESQELYLKSAEEMNKLFKDRPDTLINTLIISELCNVKKVTTEEHYLPEFQVPEGFEGTSADYLRHISWEGFNAKYTKQYINEKLIPTLNNALQSGEEPYDEEKAMNVLKERMEYELEVIITMGYDNYYLICWDFLNWALRHDIPIGRGRGSGAGSIVAYAVGIVWVDPIRWGLIFERFLNPERISLPDFDNDICFRRRGEVIQYLVDKYGVDNVSQIVAFGKLLAKGAVRDIARVMGQPPAIGDKISKLIDAKAKNLQQAIDINPELKQLYETDEIAKSIMDNAMKVEGLIRNLSTHAAGVVLMKEPIYNFIPVFRTKDGGIQTQVDMGAVEQLGGVKFDFLGLKTATVHDDCVKLIKKHEGVDINVYDLDVDDEGVYELLKTGETVGSFQLESVGMQRFMKELQPTCFEDIIAGISLYRPGPMDEIPNYIKGKRNPDKVVYDDPQMEHILKVTNGVLVYQEQVMQAVRDLAGYTFGRSDLVRRAMAKKKDYILEAEKQVFIYGEMKCPVCHGAKKVNGEKCLHCGGEGVVACTEPNQEGEITVRGCIRNGVPKEHAEVIFAKMREFAKYAFDTVVC